MMNSACSALCTASLVSTRFMKPVRCVPMIVAAYAAMPNGGQVSAAATEDRTIRFAQVCRGFRLACSSRLTGDQQRRRDHDQQEMLDHVVPEQHVVVAAQPALRGQHDDQQAAEEHPGSPERPGPGRMAVRHPPHAPKVGRRRDDDDGRDDRSPLPPAQRLRKAERREHLASHTGETTSSGGRRPCGGAAAYLAAVKLAVARTVPFSEVRRAPVTVPAASGSGLPQEPYPPSRWNDPTVMTRPSPASNWQMTVPL